MQRVKTLRTFLGNMAGPWTGWLMMRSLETLKLRMEKQERNAQKLAAFLNQHERVKRVNYLGLLTEDRAREYEVFQRQCKGTGAMVSFEIVGGEAEAFAFLNALSLVKLAVSLGSTESLAQHPKTMTHAGVDPAHLAEMQITDALIRLSVGVEHAEDIIYDLERALDEAGRK
jgi:methionine-gamma-lyase